MNYKVFISAFLGLLFLSACKYQSNDRNRRDRVNTNQNIIDDTAVSKIITINDKLFELETKICYKNHSLKIVTLCQRDSVIPEERSLFNPVVISQKLTFYNKDTVLKKLDSPCKKVRQKINSLDYLEMLDNVIYRVQIIGSENYFYYLKGYGGCNTCDEFFGLYDLNGDLLSVDYGSVKILYKNNEDIQSILKINGVKDFNDSKYILEDVSFYPVHY
ncbi:MAG TPA: hypothetical protein PKL37_23145 [Panacibacter sp.]|nr:hypothetical protein [Panacibacter sp.]